MINIGNENYSFENQDLLIIDAQAFTCYNMLYSQSNAHSV